MREERGRTKGFDDSLLREKVEVLGPEISLDVMRSSITAAIVEKLGITWDERFGELVAYKELLGDCNVPHAWPDNLQLGKWVSHQRTFHGKGSLSADREARLEDINFVWELLEVQWEEMFATLKEYIRQQGNCNVPQQWSENPQLASWVTVRRSEKRKGSLRADREARLDALGFVWAARKAP